MPVRRSGWSAVRRDALAAGGHAVLLAHPVAYGRGVRAATVGRWWWAPGSSRPTAAAAVEALAAAPRATGGTPSGFMFGVDCSDPRASGSSGWSRRSTRRAGAASRSSATAVAATSPVPPAARRPEPFPRHLEWRRPPGPVRDQLADAGGGRDRAAWRRTSPVAAATHTASARTAAAAPSATTRRLPAIRASRRSTSKDDGVVRWERQIVEEADCVEVTGSHIGLMANRKAYRVIADALPRPKPPASEIQVSDGLRTAGKPRRNWEAPPSLVREVPLNPARWAPPSRPARRPSGLAR